MILLFRSGASVTFRQFEFLIVTVAVGGWGAVEWDFFRLLCSF